MEGAAVHSSEVHKVDSGIPMPKEGLFESLFPLPKEGSKIIPSFFTIKEGSTFLTKPLFNSLYDPFGSPSRGQKPQGREDVAGSAIAPPGVWSASGACARKGLAGRAYAIKLRLFDATELRVFVG